MHPAQAKMQTLLHSLVQEGRERGVQLAVYLDGQLVVDVWAGLADPATQRPVDGTTLFPVFSSTKGPAATVLHRLVNRGQLSYDTPLAQLWPEFAAHGKHTITLRHALNHTAGLYNMPQNIGYPELCDWNAMCTAMANEKPLHPPGEQLVYHAVTYSWLVCEIACRVTGRTFPQLLQDEICQPLGLNTMFAGIPDEAEPRVAMLDEIFAPDRVLPAPHDPAPSSVPGWMQPLHTMMNRPDARRACIPASNGIMNARALAKHYAALCPGGVEGVELLPPERVRQTLQVQKPTLNPEDAPLRGLGYMLGCTSSKTGPRLTSFGHGGYGGSNGFADTQYRLAVGLTKNFYSPQSAHDHIVTELLAALGIPQ